VRIWRATSESKISKSFSRSAGIVQSQRYLTHNKYKQAYESTFLRANLPCRKDMAARLQKT
jgi:hypothetical protein